MNIILHELISSGYSEHEIKLQEIIPFWKKIPEPHRTTTALSVMLIEMNKKLYYKFMIIKVSEIKDEHYDLHTREILRSKLLKKKNNNYLYEFYYDIFKDSKIQPFKIISDPKALFKPVYKKSQRMILMSLGMPPINYNFLSDVADAIENGKDLNEYIIKYFLKQGYITKE
jgi:hypothetical protein